MNDVSLMGYEDCRISCTGAAEVITRTRCCKGGMLSITFLCTLCISLCDPGKSWNHAAFTDDEAIEQIGGRARTVSTLALSHLSLTSENVCVSHRCCLIASH